MKLSKAQCPQTAKEQIRMRHVPYQNAVGALNHATVMTRPNIAFAVHKVSQFSLNPGDLHWNTVKRIIRYLKGTQDYSLTLGGPLDTSLPLFTAYCDANFANSTDHSRSVSGCTMMIGYGCFSWSAKKQTATAGSTGEAEYYAAFQAGKQVVWLRELLSKIGFRQLIPTPLNIDNNAAMRMIETPDEVSDCVKHVRISYHWIREAAQCQKLTPVCVDTKVNIADIMTKALPGPRHSMMLEMLGMQK